MKSETFGLSNKIAVITGGTGALGSRIAETLAANGAGVVVMSRTHSKAEKLATEIARKTGSRVIGVSADVLDRHSLALARELIARGLGTADVLVNCAGGNSSSASTRAEMLEDTDDASLDASFFGIDLEATKGIIDLNLYGTLLPSLVFGRDMAKKKRGVIINISSMAAYRPLTRVPGYSASKAAVASFTEWLSVHCARMGIRVNAIAPGFILTAQNEYLLLKDGSRELTDRGKRIIEHTPMGRLGKPDDLCGTALFLSSDLSEFITGAVIPVDGGFNAYTGV